MKWVTRDYVHLDRVACPWLIKRFVDPEAQFVFEGRPKGLATMSAGYRGIKPRPNRSR